jgi:UDP-N-acetylglucosamine 1-carboxyvinyltransferase
MTNYTETQMLGQFIKELRERKEMTQSQLAEILGTSQSAVWRMESGEQNLTTDMLIRISDALNHKIITMASSDNMDFRIKGGKKLSGSLAVNTSKNGAMGLLAASLLNKGKTILHGIPKIEEVSRILEVMNSIGIKTDWIGEKTLEIVPPKTLDIDKINGTSARKTRTIVMFLGGLIHLFKQFNLPNTQGCKLGTRTINPHLFGLKKMGVDIEVLEDSYAVKVGKLVPSEIIMHEAGDTATENLLIAAAKIQGKTVIKYASANYMVQDVCFFLEKCGVVIEGIGTSTMIVHGVGEIDKTIEHYNSEDPIEAMTFLSIAIATKSELTITRCPIEFLEIETEKLAKMGQKFKFGKRYLSSNKKTVLVDIVVIPSELVAPIDKITCGAYPDLNIDNFPFFMPIVALATGTTLMHDWAYEDRVLSFLELRKVGVTCQILDQHRMLVTGGAKFKSAQVVCPPILRSAMIVLICMMAAEGTSYLRNVYQVKRGYESIAERLNAVGADIEVLSGLE